MSDTQKKKFVEKQVVDTKIYAQIHRKIGYLQYKAGYKDALEKEDIAQETLLKCLEKWEGFYGELSAESFTFWARKIAENIFYDKGRRKKSLNEILSDLTKRTASYPKTEIVLELATNIAYEKCIKKLTKKQYEVYSKQMQEREKKTGLPLKSKALSKKLNMPLGTLLPLLNRAKKTLRDCLQDQFSEEINV